MDNCDVGAIQGNNVGSQLIALVVASTMTDGLTTADQEHRCLECVERLTRLMLPSQATVIKQQEQQPRQQPNERYNVITS